VVLLIGFWFDGGLFKLATGSTFWILLELGKTGSFAHESHELNEGDFTAVNAEAGAGYVQGGIGSQQVAPVPPHPQQSVFGRLFRAAGRTPSSAVAKAMADRTAGGTPTATIVPWWVVWFRRLTLRSATGTAQRAVPTSGSRVLRWVAGGLAAVAVADSAVHLVPPHLAVGERSLALARGFLVQPKERMDFEWLAAKPIWSGVRLRVLLDHVELAGYNRELVNWQVEEEMYREFVLEPVIVGESGKRESGKAETGGGGEGQQAVETPGGDEASGSHRAEATVLMGDRGTGGAGYLPALAVSADVAAPGDGRTPMALDWRRPLWEEFYPRIRHESSPGEAAVIVLRHLHERMSVAALAEAPRSVPEIWRRQVTDAAGFEIIAVAALRSVGVPARLNDAGQAEFWDGLNFKLPDMAKIAQKAD